MGERKNEIVGVLDFETDPFLFGRIPFPFAAGIYFSADDFALLWESDSKTDFLARVARALQRLPACTLYAHNGGRFDFHYLLEYARPGSIKIRNRRIVEFTIGKVRLKDSFPLMPFALEEFRKTKIDYALFERSRRDVPRNRAKIEAYLLDDCRDLLELIVGFRAIVGDRDTIGSAAFLQMRAMGLEIWHANETHDEMFRPFYFGGRVEVFKGGLHEGNFQYLDINSAYPEAMLQSHAHGSEYLHGRTLPRFPNLGTCFIRFIGISKGALPMRAENNSLSFPIDNRSREYAATGWEIAAGLDTKTLRIDKVLDVWRPQNFICFDQYIRHFYALRNQAKESGDAIKRLAYKYLLNSGYGKFAQNPRDFKEYRLERYGKNVPGFDWETDFGALSLWSKPNFRGWGFFDVATAASITGYVRAKLWRAICASSGVLYVDTDAMICRRASVPRGDELGQWKLEGMVRRAAIAGKKLYGVEWAKPQDGQTHKIASKGARLTWRDMLALCKGDTITWKNNAPTFGINGANFIEREIRST